MKRAVSFQKGWLVMEEMSDGKMVQVNRLVSRMLEYHDNIVGIATRLDTMDEKDCPLVGHMYDHDTLVEMLQPGYRDVCCPFCLKRHSID